MKDIRNSVFYFVGKSLYVNITNCCPCRCDFCIRYLTDDMGTGDSLWLEHEPTLDEAKSYFDSIDEVKYATEIVFCGYGEPTERLDMMLELAKYMKEKTGLEIRLNTNGLSNFINKQSTEPRFKGIVDSISISLNQCNPAKYEALCHSKYGLDAFDEILKFTKEVKKYVPDVRMSVVSVITVEDIEACQEIAEGLGVPLRIR